MLRNLRKLFNAETERLGEDLSPLPSTPGAAHDTTADGTLTHSVLGQTLVVTIVDGELNHYRAADVNHAIRQLFASTPGARNLVLDMENIKYLDSAGLNTFVDLLGVVKPTGGRVAVAAATQQVEVLFKLTRLELVFTIRRTVIEAIDAVEKAG